MGENLEKRVSKRLPLMVIDPRSGLFTRTAEVTVCISFDQIMVVHSLKECQVYLDKADVNRNVNIHNNNK